MKLVLLCFYKLSALSLFSKVNIFKCRSEPSGKIEERKTSRLIEYEAQWDND